jgi:putative transposase
MNLKKLHADVNGTRVCKECFLESIPCFMDVEQTFKMQIEKFLRSLHFERYRRPWSRALGLLTQNPYFRRVLSDSPKPEVVDRYH